MPFRARENLYPGINAHLNSYLQNEAGGWESFHAEHIIDLRRVIAAYLPPGYYARAEKSLQISEYHAQAEATQRRFKAYVTVYRSEGSSESTSPFKETEAPTMVIPLIDPFDSEKSPASVTIYRVEGEDLPGRAVAHIELLSPANKSGSPYYERYIEKRYETVQGGLHLVEIDYLHHTRPLSRDLPRYPHDSGATPYAIFISQVGRSSSRVYGFGVGDIIPTLNVPLAGDDLVRVPFGEAYNRTYANLDIPQFVVDYATDPPTFDRYSEVDQQQIHSILQAIRAKT